MIKVNNQHLELIIQKLNEIGITQYESKAYIALLKAPEITAYEISKLSTVPQSKIYSTMKKLVSKQLVIHTGTKPIKYVPLPLEDFLATYKNDLNLTLDFLETNIKNINQKTNNQWIWHFDKRDQTFKKIKKIIEESQKTIYLNLWDSDYNELIPDLEQAYKKGIKITSIVYGSVKNKIGKVYYHELENMKKEANENGKWVTIISDEQECIFAIDKEDEFYGTWTQNKEFMLLSESFVLHDILMAEIYLKFGEKLDKEFGKNMKNIRNKLTIH